MILDALEKIYLAGFPFLLSFITFFPLYIDRRRSAALDTCISTGGGPLCSTDAQAAPSGAGVAAMEFLPLMLTSVYCAVGLVWGFLRLMFVYLHEESTYQGQLSSIR